MNMFLKLPGVVNVENNCYRKTDIVHPAMEIKKKMTEAEGTSLFSFTKRKMT